MTVIRRFTLPLVVCALLSAVAAWGFAEVPDGTRIPTHWNFRGEVDGWSGRTFGLLFPVVTAIASTALLAFLPLLDPRRRNIAQSTKALVMVSMALNCLLLVIAIVTVLNATGRDVDMIRALALSLGALFVVVGNYLTKLRSNFFIGIRTPWTLSDDRVWARTHHVGGRLFVATGAAGIVVGLFWPGAGMLVAAGGALLSGLVSSAYSYVIFRRRGAATAV